MKRITLIHWNATEAQARAQMLKSAGYEVDIAAAGTREGMLALRENPPAAFVIDLTRTPSRGRDMAVFLRQQKATRAVPLVFAGGEQEKVERVRGLLPDAAYAAWEEIQPALEAALLAPPAQPVVPGSMDGYAGAPLVKKLGIRPGSVVGLIQPPPGLSDLIGQLPEGARLSEQPSDGPAGVVLLFARRLSDLESSFAAADAWLAKGGKLWLVWPKKASGIPADINQIDVRAFGLERGYVDYKISAIDATWSGLCFTRRQAE